ncbi:hypothetical protein ACN27J_27740 [Solwaraspora sp. WMMB762]|uniref:hypothetical protein n=1 Tax=Solwaraspora sp. WMMB762 TaxID=3404120 RepID=UPI003B930999
MTRPVLNSAVVEPSALAYTSAFAPDADASRTLDSGSNRPTVTGDTDSPTTGSPAYPDRPFTNRCAEPAPPDARVAADPTYPPEPAPSPTRAAGNSTAGPPHGNHPDRPVNHDDNHPTGNSPSAGTAPGGTDDDNPTSAATTTATPPAHRRHRTNVPAVLKRRRR